MFDAFYPHKNIDPGQSDEIRELTQRVLLDLIEPATLPDLLFHYTDMKGLLGIVESGMLWASHLAYMNDFSEYLHGVDVAKTMALELQKNEENDDKKQFLCELEKLLDISAISINDYPPIFIACLSSEENDLSQWRAYGKGEGGVSLGLNARKIKEQIDGFGWLVPVIYDEKKKADISKDFLERSSELFIKHLSMISENREEFFWAWYLTWRGFASHLPPFLKSAGFKQEGEWRIIVPIAANDISKVSFRVSGNLLSPYVKLRLGEERPKDKNLDKVENFPDRLPIEKVWLGPNKTESLARLSANAILEKYEYFGVSVRSSDITYRVA